MDLTQYKRLYPKFRLSWSLYQKYVRKDIMGCLNYLLSMPDFQPNAERGHRIHEKIELEGFKNVRGIEDLIDMSKDYKIESKVELERDKYIIVCKPDLYSEDFVLDWKTGHTNGYEQQLQLYMWAIGDSCRTGYIIPIDEDLEGKLTIRHGTRQYQRSKYAGDWEQRFDFLAGEVQSWINDGLLERHLRFFNK